MIDRETIAKALAAFESLPEAKKIHHRHQQRISFAYGNLAMMSEYAEADQAEMQRLRTRVAIAAGPCPCADCEAHRAS